MDFDYIDFVTDKGHQCSVGIAPLEDDFIVCIRSPWQYERFELTRQAGEALKSLLNRKL